MKVEESLNITFNETPLPPKTSLLEDGELVEEEAIEVSKTKPIEDPKTSHLEAVKRIFRYIKGTMHLGLWYPKGSDIETIVYADSDHAGDYVDRKSTSGVCTFMGCCLTSWFSKKQTALAISTTEAEYVSAGKACQQALWMKQALIDYGIRLDNIPIMCDNKGAIDLSKNPVQHSRTKHIEIRHHFLRDNVQKGNISLEKVSSEDNIADILTKPLKREPFNYLRLVEAACALEVDAMGALNLVKAVGALDCVEVEAVGAVDVVGLSLNILISASLSGYLTSLYKTKSSSPKKPSSLESSSSLDTSTTSTRTCHLHRNAHFEAEQVLKSSLMPRLNVWLGGNGNAPAKVYVVGNVGTNLDSKVVTGTFLLNNRYASILFDTGADRSFVSTAFSSLIDITPTTLDHYYDVELADGKIIRINTIIRGCTLNFLNHPFNIDLMPVELGSFDVIIGMDWLSKYHAVIDCAEKIVRIP
ncbi:copia protein [Tanacetum coccineum]